MSECEKRLYVSTACLDGNKELFYILTQYHKLGFKNVEISGPHPYKSVDELTDMLLHFRSLGMNFIFHNYFPAPMEEFVINPTSKDENIRLKSHRLIYEAVDLAKRTGVDLYCIHPGYLKDPLGINDGMFYFGQGKSSKKENCFERLTVDFMKYYESLNLESANQDLFIGLENLFPQKDGSNYSILCTKEDIAAIFDTEAVSRSNLGLLIDLSHLAISSEIFGFDRYYFIDEVIQKYGDRIYEVHLSENDATYDRHAAIKENSWQLKVLDKFRNTGSRLAGCNTKFCIESRRLSVDDLFESYKLIKKVMEDIL